MAMGLGLGLGLSRGGGAAAAVVLGNELVQNGNFSSSTGWTLTTPGGGTAAISGGTLNFDTAPFGANAATTALETLTAGSYRVTFTLVSDDGGNIKPVVGGTNGTARSVAGTYTEDIVTAASNQLLVLQGASSPVEMTLVIDNFSVKRIN